MAYGHQSHCQLFIFAICQIKFLLTFYNMYFNGVIKYKHVVTTDKETLRM